MERPLRRSVLLERIALQRSQALAIRRLETMARHAVYRRKRRVQQPAAPATLLVYRQALSLGCAAEDAVLLRAALRIRGEARDEGVGVASASTVADSSSDTGRPRHHDAGRRGARRLAAVRCLAAQYVAEARVAVWLAACNVRGVAPVTADLVAELCRQWPDAGVSPESLRLLTWFCGMLTAHALGDQGGCLPSQRKIKREFVMQPLKTVHMLPASSGLVLAVMNTVA